MEVLQLNEHWGGPVYLTPVSSESMTQYYLLDTDGSLLPAFVAEQDDEIPSWKLDHMYAKRREPGTEQKPPKRRSKKKEVLTSQFFVPEMIEDPPPKINIIRQRHAVNPNYGYSRPKILTQMSTPHKFYNACSSTNSIFSSSSSATTNANANSSGSLLLHNPHHHHHHQRKFLKEDLGIHSNTCETTVPSPGAVVTVCDGDEQDNSIINSYSSCSSDNNHSVNSRSQKTAFKKYPYSTNSSTTSQLLLQQLTPAHVENRNSSLDSIGGEPDDDSELFFDFPMEEEGSNLDVDFTSATKGILESNDEHVSLNFFHHSDSSSSDNNNSHHNNNRCTNNDITDDAEITDSDSVTDPSLLDNFMLSESTPLLPSWDSAITSVVTNNNNNNISSSVDNTSLTSTNTTEIVKRKRGRPVKNKIVVDSSSSCSASSAFNNTINDTTPKKSPKENQDAPPTRRSTRPIKAPSRLDDIDDSPKRKRGSISGR